MRTWRCARLLGRRSCRRRPRIISDPHQKEFPFIVRHPLKLINVEEEMRVDATG